MQKLFDCNLSDEIYDALINLGDERLIVKYLDYISFKYLKDNLIMLVRSDEIKLEYIKESNDNNVKYLMACTLKEDRNICDAFNNIFDMNSKSKLICSIKDECLRAEMVMKIAANFRMRACRTITNQTILRGLYFKNIKCFFSHEILELIHDDDLKKEMLGSYNIVNQVSIIVSMDNEENIIEFINDSKYDNYCDSFVNCLTEENVIKYFKKISNLSYKIRMINRIRNVDTKKKLILLLEKSDLKINLLGNLNNDKEQILTATGVPDICYDVDSRITIGIELEVCCEDSDIYLKLGKLLCDWEIKVDRTVQDGFEITSPILHYDGVSMRELKYICDFLKENKFYTNESCGGHIHLGFDYFESCDEFKLFITLYRQIESILCVICNRACSIPRVNVSRYAMRLSPIIDGMINFDVNWEKVKDLSGCVSLIKEKCDSRYYALNLSNAFDKKHTIEFRMPNGEIEFNELILNIRLFTKLLEVTKKITKILNKDELTRCETEELKLYRELINSKNNKRKKLNMLMRLLFDDKNYQDYLVRYTENSKVKKRKRIKIVS